MLGIRCRLAFLIALTLTLSIVGIPFCVFAVAESDARSAMAQAEERIVVCYQAVANADKTGANVTALLLTLNAAGELLSKAYLAYNMGDFDSALNFSIQSQNELDGFVDQAFALRKNAAQQHYWDFVINVVESIVGTIAVICGGFVLWSFLKRKYEKLEV